MQSFKLWLERTEAPVKLTDKVRQLFDVIRSAPNFARATADLRKIHDFGYFRPDSFYTYLALNDRNFDSREVKEKFVPKFLEVIDYCKKNFLIVRGSGFLYYAPTTPQPPTPDAAKYHVQIRPDDIDAKIPALVRFMKQNEGLIHQFKFAYLYSAEDRPMMGWDRSDKLVIYITPREQEERALRAQIESSGLTFDDGRDVKPSDESEKLSNTQIWSRAIWVYLASKPGSTIVPKDDPATARVLRQRIREMVPDFEPEPEGNLSLTPSGTSLSIPVMPGSTIGIGQIKTPEALRFMSQAQFKIDLRGKDWTASHSPKAVNQTYLNGRPLTAPSPIRDGDVLTIGKKGLVPVRVSVK